jgi:hypothetical protein
VQRWRRLEEPYPSGTQKEVPMLPHRWLIRSIVAAVVAAAGLVAVAMPAHAQPAVRTCTVQGVLMFTPGLPLVTPRFQSDLDGLGDIGPCLDAAGVVTGLTADFSVAGDPILGAGNASCTVQSLHAIMTIDWNNGNSSLVDMQSVAGALGTIAFTGSVEQGELAGNTAAFAMTSTNSPDFLLDCASPGGASSFAATGQIVFASL